MATIGLNNLYMAPITGVDTPEEAYGTPEQLAKAISVKLSINTETATLYADDAAAEVETSFVDGDIEIDADNLTPEMEAKLLGQKQDTDKVLYDDESDIASYVALGFQAKMPKGNYKYTWLYRVKFARVEEEYNTKGEKIEFSTPKLVGKIVPRPDGKWRSRYVGKPADPTAKNWFKVVREEAVIL